MKKCNYLLITALTVICLLGCGKKKKVEIDVEKVIGTDAMHVEYTQSTYVINPEDLSEITTFSPYIFVGEVEKYEKTEYLNGDEDNPITYYSVKVIENIKGKLTQKENIVIKKAGGLKKDTDIFLIDKGDVLPAAGNTYIFCAVIHEDDLYSFCHNMVAELDTSKDYSTTETYRKYIEALEVKADIDEAPGDQKSRYDESEKE